MSLARFTINDAGLRLISALLLLALWQLVALSGSPLMPGPVAVARALIDDATQGYLLSDLGYTLARVAASFIIAMAAGSAIGMLMGRSRPVDGLFDLWLVLGLNVPALVIIILCYLWIGLNETAAIAAVALNKVAQSAVILREGARSVDTSLLQVAEVFRVPWGRKMRRAYLPQLYPYFMAATRSGLSLIWKIVLVVELLGRSNGVGFRLGLYFQFFDIANILAYSASFIAIMLAIEGFIIRPLERRLTRWRA
jgi:NitT/TauT family transport system permease protein